MPFAGTTGQHLRLGWGVRADMSKKMIAEALGTFILVFFGCGSAVLMGAQIGMLGIG